VSQNNKKRRGSKGEKTPDESINEESPHRIRRKWINARESRCKSGVNLDDLEGYSLRSEAGQGARSKFRHQCKKGIEGEGTEKD